LARRASGAAPRPKVGGGAKLNESQLRWLITFVSVHLDDAMLQTSLFGLLRVIFGRKFVLPELYDLVLLLGDMVMQADAPAVRHSASQLFITFLLTYPLGPKRLQQHLNFLVTNLSYPVAQGRLSLLELLASLVDKLPLPVLHRQAELLLLPLVTRLVNDDDHECRQAVGRAITRLLRRTCDTGGDADCAAARERIFKLLRAWYADDALPALRQAAAQLASLAVDALGASCSSLLNNLIPLIVHSCQREADGPPTAEASSSAEISREGGEEQISASASSWQSAYYSLRALERYAAADSSLLSSAACAPLWSPLQRLLLHDHAWLRSAAGRVIGGLLATLEVEALAAATVKAMALEASGASAAGDADGDGGSSARAVKKAKRSSSSSRGHGDKTPAPPSYLCRRGALLELTDALVQQLHSSVISPAAAAQTLKNLIWTCIAFVRHPELAPPSCRAFLPGAAAAVVAANGAGSDAAGGDAGALDATGGSRGFWTLEAVAGRLASLTQTSGHTRGCTAMRWYAAIASQLSSDQLQPLLPALMAPVARAADDRSGKVHLRVKEMAGEALQLLQKRAETPDFVAAYQKLKEGQKAARRERKQREAVEAVAEPERAAQKRIAINQGKRKAKKRKLDRQKRSRDSGGSVGLGSKKARRAKPEM